jgi:hypothetical protein
VGDGCSSTGLEIKEVDRRLPQHRFTRRWLLRATGSRDEKQTILSDGKIHRPNQIDDNRDLLSAVDRDSPNRHSVFHNLRVVQILPIDGLDGIRPTLSSDLRSMSSVGRHSPDLPV